MITLNHKFVKTMPDNFEFGTIYISMEYATAIHLCICGCGQKVVTPFSPTDWRLIYDGRTVTLDPSIGNWSFACQSHYWITRSRVRMARKWTKSQIEQGRKEEQLLREIYYQGGSKPSFLRQIFKSGHQDGEE